jgi:hypothetical protein
VGEDWIEEEEERYRRDGGEKKSGCGVGDVFGWLGSVAAIIGGR